MHVKSYEIGMHENAANKILDGFGGTIYIEDLYQAFKERMLKEQLIVEVKKITKKCDCGKCLYCRV
jgi:hypothetical protein